MKKYVNDIKKSINDNIEMILKNITYFHIEFERIHPFIDGNGRTGRIILNQMLMNYNLLPIYFLDNSDYRNSFKIYDEKKDTSKLLHLICKGEIESINLINGFIEKYNKSNDERKYFKSK